MNSDRLWVSYQDFAPNVDVSQSSPTHAQYVLSEELLERIQSSANRKALLELQIGIEQLILEPTEFDTWSTVIKDRLCGNDLINDDLSLAISVLIEMVTINFKQ